MNMFSQNKLSTLNWGNLVCRWFTECNLWRLVVYRNHPYSVRCIVDDNALVFPSKGLVMAGARSRG